ncbi:MAG TPA: DNA repair protein RadA [Acidimicrobiales bacterium]|nr:DNA repair protein RadA [Acidimicrobiales bacterium]
MPRPRSVHRCVQCDAPHPRWAGRCGSCGAWNTLVEEYQEAPSRPGARAQGATAAPVRLVEVDGAGCAPRPTGLDEVDRVLAGGLVPGSVTLVGGEPGIGKSTLLLQAAAALSRAGCRALLISAEESPQQVRLRAERLGVLDHGLWLAAETSLPGVCSAVAEVAPEVLVLDSIQTVADPEVGSVPGSVPQVRECASRLVQEAKGRGMAVLLVGHVTKDGALAGPRVLEHMVDTVLSFEGERHHALRLLRATKHRFGPTGELGLFEMTGGGLVGVPDPSGLLLGDRRSGEAGGVVVPAMEGHRPLLVEVQALVTPTRASLPRRSAQGLDQGRLVLLLAVLAKRAGLSFSGADVFASVVGGVRVSEPAADLALALALASASAGVALPADTVVCGEVGLGGEVRQVAHVQRRLAEAARLGFTRALVPASSPAGPAGLEVVRVGHLAEAVDAVMGQRLRRSDRHGRTAPPPRHRGLPRSGDSHPR